MNETMKAILVIIGMIILFGIVGKVDHDFEKAEYCDRNPQSTQCDEVEK